MAAIRVIRYREVSPLNIRRARRASGLSAKALSRKAGLHDQFVSRLERGLVQEIEEPTFDALATAMVGEGDFIGCTKIDVERVMNGLALFRLTPAKEVGGVALTSTDDDGVMGGKRSRHLALNALRQAA